MGWTYFWSCSRSQLPASGKKQTTCICVCRSKPTESIYTYIHIYTYIYVYKLSSWNLMWLHADENYGQHNEKPIKKTKFEIYIFILVSYLKLKKKRILRTFVCKVGNRDRLCWNDVSYHIPIIHIILYCIVCMYIYNVKKNGAENANGLRYIMVRSFLNGRIRNWNYNCSGYSMT